MIRVKGGVIESAADRCPWKCMSGGDGGCRPTAQMQGGVQISTALGGCNRRGLIRRFFPLQRDFWTLNLLWLPLMNFLPLGTSMISGLQMMAMKESAGQAIEQSDLFATTYKRSCARCGEPFDAPIRRGNGRPAIFCSESCRIEQAKSQRREWQIRKGLGLTA